MVSSTLNMSIEALCASLERLRVEHGQDPEYQQLRSDLPSDWPL